MSLLYSWAMIQNKLQEDLDLINEPFITPDELLGYVNEAIEDAETAIHTFGLGADYFMVNTFRMLVPGQTNYSFPADIYANKLRRVFYRNPTIFSTTTYSGTILTNTITVASASGISPGQSVFGTGIPLETSVVSVVGLVVTLSQNLTSTVVTQAGTFVSLQPATGARQYEIKRMRRIENTQSIMPGQDYEYLIMNNQVAAGGNQIVLFPPPVENGPFLQMFYLREMHRLTNSLTDPNNVCEIPECINFIFKHVKWNVGKKRRTQEVISQLEADMTKAYGLMEETLKEMVPDENNKIEMDLSSYYSQETERYY